MCLCFLGKRVAERQEKYGGKRLKNRKNYEKVKIWHFAQKAVETLYFQ